MEIINNNFDTKIKYHKYSHYLLPIAIEPLKYGKLIDQFVNKYIIQLNTSNVIVIRATENENLIKLYRKGDFMFEFTDTKVNNEKFTRVIFDQRFTFEKNKLISTEILNGDEYVNIFNKITPFLVKLSLLYILFQDSFETNNIISMVALSSNLMKLRKEKTKNRWTDVIIKINNKIFNRSLFETEFRRIWNEISLQLNEKNIYFILFSNVLMFFYYFFLLLNN